MRGPAKSSAVRPWCRDAGSGVMLIPLGRCSMLMLLLHPLPAGARNGCQSFLPMLDRQQRSSGCSGFAVPGRCPLSGQGEGRQCPLNQSCLSSPSLLCPRILSQKWEKNSPSQGVPPTSAGGCAPKSRGKQAKTSQEPKKKKNQNCEDFWKSTTCFGCRPALIASTEAPGCSVVPGLASPAVLCKPSWGHPINARAPQSPPGVFFLPALLQGKGKPGLGSTHRGGESSFPLGPSPDVPLV